MFTGPTKNSSFHFILFYSILILVHGFWGPWTEDFACDAACEGQGVQGEKRTCSEPQNGGTECIRENETITTPGNRLEMRENSCVNPAPCPGTKHK